MKKDVAFSGLEAAIVLIAFVVVAAVFSYVMLGAGFFATQKSQEVTYSGIKQSTSNLVLDGQVYGQKSEAGAIGGLTTVTFTLAIPEGGQAQNLGSVVIIWTANNQAQSVVAHGETAILSPGDKEEFTIAVPSTTYPLGAPQPGDSFTMEIKPNVGASTLITKTLSTGYEGGAII